jgi:hypothetical protein
MTKGSQPTDGGNLLLGSEERCLLLQAEPAAATFIRRFAGAEEFINGTERFCLWIEDGKRDAAARLPAIKKRFEQVRAQREASPKRSTQDMASKPWRFTERRHREGQSIIVPRVSSERRDYIPMGFLDEETVISSEANAIYGAGPWVFALIQSRMHMAWVRAVAGRLKSDYRYSAVLVYNTFSVPDLTHSDKENLQLGAMGVLAARERFSGNTLAELYDPEKMPASLRNAHERLDEIVDRIYRKRPFESDEDRLEMLFEMYSEMTSDGEKADA